MFEIQENNRPIPKLRLNVIPRTLGGLLTMDTPAGKATNSTNENLRIFTRDPAESQLNFEMTENLSYTFHVFLFW